MSQAGWKTSSPAQTARIAAAKPFSRILLGNHCLLVENDNAAKHHILARPVWDRGGEDTALQLLATSGQRVGDEETSCSGFLTDRRYAPGPG